MLMVYLLPLAGFHGSFQSGPEGWRAWPPGRELGYQKVAAELEVESGKLWVVAIGEIFDALVGGELRGGRSPFQDRTRPAEETLMLFDVGVANGKFLSAAATVFCVSSRGLPVTSL